MNSLSPTAKVTKPHFSREARFAKFCRNTDLRKVRQKGSHAIMQKAIENSTITVPVPLHSEIRIGTLQSIIRQSSIARSEFEAN